MSVRPSKDKEAQIAKLVELLTNEPALNNEIPLKYNKSSQLKCHKELFASILNNGRELVYTCFVILDGFDGKGKHREGLQDELLKCLVVLQKVVQRQTKWRKKTRFKQYCHSRKYKRELQHYCAQFQASKTRIHAGFNPYQRKKIGLKIPILLEPPSKFTTEPLVGQSRKQILQQLHKNISVESRHTSMAALVGGAGTGKSHIAGQFVKMWLEQKGDKNDSHRTVFWISAQTEESVREGYSQILSQAHEEASRESTKNGSVSFETSTMQLAREVWNKLECLSALGIDWLVVLDHVPEVLDGLQGPGSFLPFFFPTSAVNDTTSPSRGSILFTTRSTEFNSESRLGVISPIVVEALSGTEAVDLLIARTSESNCAETREAAATTIAETFGKEECCFLPFAVSKLANTTPIISRSVQDRASQDTVIATREKVTAAVMESMEPVLRHVCLEGEGRMLSLLACWPSPKDLNALSKVANQGRVDYIEEDGIMMSLERLCRLGVVQWDESMKVYRIYKIYQLAIQAYLEKRQGAPPAKRKKKKVVRFASCRNRSRQKYKEDKSEGAIPEFILVDVDDDKVKDSIPPIPKMLQANRPSKRFISTTYSVECSHIIRAALLLGLSMLALKII